MGRAYKRNWQIEKIFFHFLLDAEKQLALKHLESFYSEIRIASQGPGYGKTVQH
jgi:hypothetical protein